MAAWCLLTGQPFDAYRVLTRLEREKFAEIAKQIPRGMI